MVRHILSTLFFLSVVCTAADYAARAKGGTTMPASDPKIVYTGRTLTSDGCVSFDWSGVTARLKFNGTYIAVKVSDTKANYFNVWVDEVPSHKENFTIRTSGTDTLIIIAGSLKKVEHSVVLQKRTEGEQGTVTFKSFITDGCFLQAEGAKQRQIEFIGDSYTCGFGSENSIATDPFKPETENCNLTYAAVASRYFDADFTLLCHSGQGVVRNYGGQTGGHTMTDRYSQIFDENMEYRWNPDSASYRPDIVVIYLGANDFSTETQPSLNSFSERYAELLGKVKGFYGAEIPVLCIAVKLDPAIFDYIKAACARSGFENISCMTMQSAVHNETSDLGACYHPNYSGHRKMASVIIPYISTITGWDMEEKPYL